MYLHLIFFTDRSTTTLRAKTVARRGKPSPAVAPDTPSASIPEAVETEPSPPRDDHFYDADANVSATTEDAGDAPAQGGESNVQMDLDSSAAADDEGPVPSPTKTAEASAKDAQTESTSAPSQDTEVHKEKSPEPATETVEEPKAADNTSALTTTTASAKAARAEATAAPQLKLHAAPGTDMVKAAPSQQMTSHAGTSSGPRSVSTEAFGFAELEVASNSMLKMVQNSVLSIRAATKVLPLLTFYLVNFHTHILM